MNTYENPYKILEVPHGTPFAEVRIKYYKIARTHHPDKFIGTDEEKLHNEEYFKKVTVAYRRIEVAEQNGTNIDENTFNGIFGFGSSNFNYTDYSKDEWRNVWSSVESFFNKPEVWTCMKNIITDTLKEVATKVYQKHHAVTLSLKLEEIYAEKTKKLRLFLNNIPEPVFINVNAANFPHKIVKHATLSNGQEIEINVDCIAIEHELYQYDNILGTDDIYTTFQVTLSEYILGKKLTLRYLDGNDISINMLPFGDLSKSICIPKKGLRKNKGNLYICINITLPDKELWDSQTIDFKEKLLKSLNALYKN
jgi:DnaJ-class molecular chaperone